MLSPLQITLSFKKIFLQLRNPGLLIFYFIRHFYDLTLLICLNLLQFFDLCILTVDFLFLFFDKYFGFIVRLHEKIVLFLFLFCWPLVLRGFLLQAGNSLLLLLFFIMELNKQKTGLRELLFQIFKVFHKMQLCFLKQVIVFLNIGFWF